MAPAFDQYPLPLASRQRAHSVAPVESANSPGLLGERRRVRSGVRASDNDLYGSPLLACATVGWVVPAEGARNARLAVSLRPRSAQFTPGALIIA